jgi:hypothetical protein
VLSDGGQVFTILTRVHPKLATIIAFSLSLITPPLLAGEAQGAGEVEAKKILQSIIENHLQPPPGRRAAELVPLLTRSLASSDPQLRDDLAFSILSDWIYEHALLTPEELRPLAS